MAFEKGQSGNPGGRPKVKPFRNALDEAIQEAKKTPGQELDLVLIAKMLLIKAKSGDVAAIKEIADRYDGKPAQAIENGEDGGFELIHTIRRIIVDTGHPDSASVPATADTSEI